MNGGIQTFLLYALNGSVGEEGRKPVAGDVDAYDAIQPIPSKISLFAFSTDVTPMDMKHGPPDDETQNQKIARMLSFW